jgi:hypothetical protein
VRRVWLLEEAAEEAVEAAAWYEQECPGLGVEFEREINAALDLLEDEMIPLTGLSRRLSENSDRSEGEAGCVGFLDHLRRIVVLFNEKDRKIRPARLVRSRSVYSRTAS